MNFRMKKIFKFLILFIVSFSANANNSDKTPVFSYYQIEETYKAAKVFFDYGQYPSAFAAYQTILMQEKASKKTKARCLKKMGEIEIRREHYSEAENLFLEAKKELPADREIIRGLKYLSEIKGMSNRYEKYLYVVQVGAFTSSNNANNVIKNIRTFSDSFSLKKYKKGKLFIVHFDGFISKKDADDFATKLQSLNENLKFFVKQKNIPGRN